MKKIFTLLCAMPAPKLGKQSSILLALVIFLFGASALFGQPPYPPVPNPTNTAACNDNIQVSLGQNGIFDLYPDNLLEGGPYDYNLCSVSRDGTNFSQFITFTCADIGSPIIIYAANSASGSLIICSGYVLVQDNLPPTITCPQNQTVPLDANCDPVYPAPTVSDNCTAVQDIAVTALYQIFTIPVLKTIVTLQAIDGSFNFSAPCTYTVFPPICCTITGNNIICEGQSTELCTTPGAADYLWSTGATTNCITVSTAGTYSVTVMDANGDSIFCNATVLISPLPVANAGDDVTICPGACVLLGAPADTSVVDSVGNPNPNSGITYSWSPSTGLSCTACPNPVACPATTQTYTLTVANADGCVSTDEVTVTVVPDNSVAAFTTVPAPVSGVIHICLGQSVYFIDQSTGVVSYFWDFGDGFSSSQQSPVHPYNFAGTYTVTFTATGSCGIPQVLTTTVEVESLPAPEIVCPSVVCAGDIAVYSTTAVCNPYVWSVTGGTIISSPLNQNSIMVAWGNPPGGFGTVSLSVPGCPGFCNNPAIVLVPIVPPTLPVSGATIVCVGNTATYSVPCIPGNVYTWNVPPPAQLVSGQGTHEIQVLFDDTSEGMHTITVDYTNLLSGCSGAGTINVNVLPTLSLSGPVSLCLDMANTGSPFNAFNANTLAPANVNWSVITPANNTLSNLQTNSSSFDTYTWNAGPGTYQVIATAPAGIFCNDVATTTVVVLSPPPMPSAISGDVTICPGGAYNYAVIPNTVNVDYSWTITGGTPATATGPSPGISITWNANGPYGISVQQQFSASPFCTSGPSTLTVTDYPVVTVPTISGPVSFCANTSNAFTFSGTSAANTTYTWSVSPPSAGSVTSTSGSSATIQWASGFVDVSASVVLTVVAPCATTPVNYPVTVFAQPQPFITAPSSACQGTSVNFTGSGGGTYAWTFTGGSPASSSNPSESVSYSSAGTFPVTLTVTNGNNCVSSTSSSIVINPVPSYSVITGTLSFCQGSSTTLTAPAAASYQWSPGGQMGQSLVTSAAGSYSVAMLTTEGCPSPPDL